MDVVASAASTGALRSLGSPIALQASGAVQWPLLVVGLALVVAAVVDLLWTTLWTDGGAGPLTAALMAGTWHGLRSVRSGRSRFLSLSGPLVLSLTLATWVVLLVAGWTLVFGSGANSLAYTRGPEPVSWVGRLYFVAYTLFTMGNGDFSPTSDVWRIATGLTNASGMVLVTLGVTYVINVLQAVVEKRSFASTVRAIGERGDEFVAAGWEEGDFAEHDLTVNDLSSQLSTIASQHRAYPILHYYRGAGRRHSLPIAVAIFDDALTLFRFGVPRQDRPGGPLLATARSSVDDYLRSVYTLPVRPADSTPRAPSLARLRSADVPTVSDGEFGDALSSLDDRRRRLLGVVESQSWSWPRADDE